MDSCLKTGYPSLDFFMNKKIRVITTCVVILALFVVTGTGAYANSDYNYNVNVYVEDKFIVFLDQEPFIDAKVGRTYVPIRFIAEALKADVDWDGTNRKVNIDKQGTKIILTIDSDIALVNGKEVKLDAPAKIISGRTIIPLRFISESFGEVVKWNPSKTGGTVEIKPIKGHNNFESNYLDYAIRVIREHGIEYDHVPVLNWGFYAINVRYPTGIYITRAPGYDCEQTRYMYGGPLSDVGIGYYGDEVSSPERMRIIDNKVTFGDFYRDLYVELSIGFVKMYKPDIEERLLNQIAKYQYEMAARSEERSISNFIYDNPQYEYSDRDMGFRKKWSGLIPAASARIQLFPYHGRTYGGNKPFTVYEIECKQGNMGRNIFPQISIKELNKY